MVIGFQVSTCSTITINFCDERKNIARECYVGARHEFEAIQNNAIKYKITLCHGTIQLLTNKASNNKNEVHHFLHSVLSVQQSEKQKITYSIGTLFGLPTVSRK